MVSQKLTVCNCKGTITISGGSNLSGLVAHATSDRRLRRIRIFTFGTIFWFGIFYLVHRKYQPMVKTMEVLSSFTKRHSVFAVGLIVYLAMLQVFQARAFIEETNHLFVPIYLTLY